MGCSNVKTNESLNLIKSLQNLYKTKNDENKDNSDIKYDDGYLEEDKKEDIKEENNINEDLNNEPTNKEIDKKTIKDNLLNEDNEIGIDKEKEEHKNKLDFMIKVPKKNNEEDNDLVNIFTENENNNNNCDSIEKNSIEYPDNIGIIKKMAKNNTNLNDSFGNNEEGNDNSNKYKLKCNSSIEDKRVPFNIKSKFHEKGVNKINDNEAILIDFSSL